MAMGDVLPPERLKFGGPINNRNEASDNGKCQET